MQQTPAVGKSRHPTLAEAPVALVDDAIDRVFQSVRRASRSGHTPSKLGNKETPLPGRQSARAVGETHRDRFRNALHLPTASPGCCRRHLTGHEVPCVGREATTVAACGSSFAANTRLASGRSSSVSAFWPPWEGFPVTEKPVESYMLHYDSCAPGLFAKLQISSGVRTASPPPSRALAVCGPTATND